VSNIHPDLDPNYVEEWRELGLAPNLLWTTSYQTAWRSGAVAAFSGRSIDVNPFAVRNTNAPSWEVRSRAWIRGYRRCNAVMEEQLREKFDKMQNNG
jgi:hypothetical protein